MDKALADPEAVRLERIRGRQARVLDERALAEAAIAARGYRNAPKSGRMNKTEAAYAEQLENLRIGGYLRWWKYGTLSLRLADRTWYRPDFLVEARGGQLEIHEVKGHWEDDARVKFKVAAELYPMFRFFAVRREGSAFVVIETLNPH